MASVNGPAPSQGVFRWPLFGTPALVVGAGTPAPGGTTFLGFDTAGQVLSRNNRIAYRASLAAGQSGIYLAQGGGTGTGTGTGTGYTVFKVAEVNDAAPGTGTTFAQFGTMALSPTGRVMFAVQLASGASEIFEWQGPPSGPVVQLIADGAVPPAPLGGTVLISSNIPNVDMGYGLNDVPVFITALTGAAVGASEAMFKIAPPAGLTTVLTQGAGTPTAGTFLTLDDGAGAFSVDSFTAVGTHVVAGAGAYFGVFATLY